MKKIKRLAFAVKRIFSAIDRDCVFVYAGQASLMIIISLFPFAMLLLSLVQYVLPVEVTELSTYLRQIFPVSTISYVEDVLNEVFSRPTFSFFSVTAVTTLWTASRGVNAVKNGLRRMYHTPANRGFVYNTATSLFYTVSILVALIATLLLLTFGNGLVSVIEGRFPWTAWITALLMRLRSVISLVLLTLFFMVVYRTLPGQKLQFRRQLPGAIFSAVGWTVFSLCFSLYINNFGHYTYIYGGLTAVVLTMVWLYTCMSILLIGAEINAYLLYHTLPRPRMPRRRESTAADEISDELRKE